MKAIPEYEGQYVISETGEVWSLDRTAVGKDGTVYPFKGKKLTVTTNAQTSYLQVDLWKNNKAKRFYIHRLLALVYLPNAYNKPEVNHIDSDRQNNSLSNLEWVTSSENSLHAYAYGEASQAARRKLEEEDYLKIFNRFLAGESFTSILHDFDISAGRLSVNLRNLVKKWGRMQEYVDENLRQKRKRTTLRWSN